MKSKAQMRDMLTTGMEAFLAKGKTITKVEPKRSYKQKEKIVEIQVEDLPVALQRKYFAEQ